jgi:hypothetical protein
MECLTKDSLDEIMKNKESISGWKIVIDTQLPYEIVVEGEGAEQVDISNDCLNIVLKGKYYDHVLVDKIGNKVTLYAMQANMIPCYCRMLNGKLILSNIANNLILEKEVVELDTYVLFQNLTGTPYPQKNIFHSIKLLEASSIYELNSGDLVYKGSQLQPRDGVEYDEVFNCIKDKFKHYLRSGDDVNILLSAGYDSRLNLALALDGAKYFGNKIHTFHLYKNDTELDISSGIAREHGVEFEHSKKEDFYNKEWEPLKFDRGYIEFHSGNYRDDLQRWHNYIDYINAKNQSAVTIGLGAEAHKGKFYDQLRKLNSAESVLGISREVVPEICDALGIRRYSKYSQTKFFNDLVEKSKIYERLDQQVDFMHYHTYVSNGWSGRFHDMIRYYNIPFPFVEHDFLNLVFSLPQSKKQNFMVTKEMLATLGDSYAKFPYVSGNIKSTKGRSVSVKNLLPVGTVVKLKKLRSSILGQSIITRGHQLSESERIAIEKTRANTYPSQVLKDILLQKTGILPHIRISFTIQMFLYLNFLEETKNVDLIFK